MVCILAHAYGEGLEGAGMEGKALTLNTEAQITHHGHV